VTTVGLGVPAHRTGLEEVPRLADGDTLGKKDFTSSSEVRWCPGCGDYAILAAVQGFLPELGIRRENVVCISGIGCSSRFPYYLDTFGMHSIHGRAPAIATGLATSRPDLNVWVVTGDGDALSIGGNHLIHALRRNVNLTILLFNNRIYGLTKGQYSPTSEVGKVTKSTPAGSVDSPFNPVSLALGAEASFVARTMDSDRKHLTSVLRAAVSHRGAALVEIYQNCPIFNDGAFDVLKDREEATARLVHLEHGAELRFGPDGAQKVVVRAATGAGVEVVDAAEADGREVVVHDAHAADPSTAFALSRLDDVSMAHVPVGIFRDVERPTYDDLVRDQLAAARQASGGPATDDDLARLLAGSDTWTVPAG
jgi:2-oxoglutarate ferredoxin oxidoreductase subunit beta